MTDGKLNEIRARCEAATPGPWRNIGEPLSGYPRIFSDAEHGGFRQPFICGIRAADEQANNDAEFMAHAREDIPALLDALEAAEARAERICRLITEWIKDDPECEGGFHILCCTCGERLDCGNIARVSVEEVSTRIHSKYCPGCGARIERGE